LTSRGHSSDFLDSTTDRCERALVTLLGDIGPWRERVCLVGGLVPRYLTARLPEGASPHVGTQDIDLVIGVALGDDTPETYRTLQNNLERAGFHQSNVSFQYTREVDGIPVRVEFICETDKVEPGRIFNPKDEGAGSKLGAFNVRGALLVRDDFIERTVGAERLDSGGRSRVTAKIAGLLSFVTLKVFAFQDRHENKDAYDLVFTLLYQDGGPESAGKLARSSRIVSHPFVEESLALLEQRFADTEQDGPAAYSAFLGAPGNAEEHSRLRREAVATVKAFLAGFRRAAA